LRLNLADYGLAKDAPCSARSFWDGRLIACDESGFSVGPVPPHGVILLSVTRMIPNEPVYCGSDLHISQGCEVTAWLPRADGLTFELGLPREAAGVVDLILPYPPRSTSLDGSPVIWWRINEPGPARYRISVAFDRTAHLEILYNKDVLE
jgi:hypothetical protein